MSAEELVTYLTWATYAIIFAIVARRALRTRRRFDVDVALFFGAPFLVIVLGTLEDVGRLTPTRWLTAGTGVLTLSLAYLLLRLLHALSPVPRWLLWLALAGWLVLSAGLLMEDPTRFPALTLLLFLYLIGFQFYATVLFMRQARRTRGVTRRRLRAVASGSGFLGLTFLFTGLTVFTPAFAAFEELLSQAAGIASAIAYFFGFATPAWLRHAWQEPELRAFLTQAAHLPRLSNTQAIVEALAQGTATALGAPRASVGLWDEASQQLLFATPDSGMIGISATTESTTGRVFLSQQAEMTTDAPQRNVRYAALIRQLESQTILAAPITAGNKRLGVLAVSAAREPIFAEDDLGLLKLLASQAAVVLESRALIDEAARVQARAEATRLKEDFLSVAAHDLKTPLTTLLGYAQLMERRARRHPDAPADLKAVQFIRSEAERLRTLVLELLDASRAEQGQLVGAREATDLVPLVAESAARHQATGHLVTLNLPPRLVVPVDPTRFQQLVENLLENAIKYGTVGQTVRVALEARDGSAHLSVADQGIGVAAEDLPHIFERFFRGQNVQAERHNGMGLGLFICRSIAEQHGGRLWATSHPGQGTTFYVELPLGEPTMEERSSGGTPDLRTSERI